MSVLFHLLLAFPSGRLESRAARVVAAIGYAVGALQVPFVLVTDCAGCPDNPVLIAADDTAAGVIESLQGLLGVVAIIGTAVLLIRRWWASNAFQRRGLEPVLAVSGAILVLGLATLVTRRRRPRAPQLVPDRLLRRVRAVPGRVPRRLAAHALLPHARRCSA